MTPEARAIDSDRAHRALVAAILSKHRREIMVRCIIATQAREGVKTTRAQAEAAYDNQHSKQSHTFNK